VCAYNCVQLSYTIHHRTVLIISLLTSRQSSQLKCCLLEGSGATFESSCFLLTHVVTDNRKRSIIKAAHFNNGQMMAKRICFMKKLKARATISLLSIIVEKVVACKFQLNRFITNYYYLLQVQVATAQEYF